MEKSQLIESLEAERDEILRQMKEIDDNRNVLIKQYNKIENRIELINFLKGDSISLEFVKDLANELEKKPI